MYYRSGTVNSKFHLIQSFCEIFVCNCPNILCLKCTVDSNFHLIRGRALPTDDFELTVQTCGDFSSNLSHTADTEFSVTNSRYLFLK